MKFLYGIAFVCLFPAQSSAFCLPSPAFGFEDRLVNALEYVGCEIAALADQESENERQLTAVVDALENSGTSDVEFILGEILAELRSIDQRLETLETAAE